MIYKTMIDPKFWAHSKENSNQESQDLQYTIDFGRRHWAI